jgi:hypothetical protein
MVEAVEGLVELEVILMIVVQALVPMEVVDLVDLHYHIQLVEHQFLMQKVEKEEVHRMVLPMVLQTQEMVELGYMVLTLVVEQVVLGLLL